MSLCIWLQYTSAHAARQHVRYIECVIYIEYILGRVCTSEREVNILDLSFRPSIAIALNKPKP
jgi:hypothetical protein